MHSAAKRIGRSYVYRVYTKDTRVGGWGGAHAQQRIRKRCVFPLSIGGDVKGKIAGKELTTKEPQVDKGKTVSLHLKKTKTAKKIRQKSYKKVPS